MAASAGTVTLELDANSVKLLRELQKSERATKRSAQNMRKEFADAFKAIAAATVAAGAAFGVLVRQSIDAADKIGKLSQQLGVSTRFLSEMEHAAKLSGVSLGEIEGGLRRLSRTASDAANGLSTANRAFGALGITVKNADGSLRDTESLMLDVAEAFAGIQDGAAKAAVAQELFGRSGAQLIPLLNRGRDGIAELREEAQRLGLSLSQEASDSAQRFNDNLTRLRGAMDGVVRQTMSGMIDTLDALSDRFVQSVNDTDGMTTAVRQLETAFKILLSTALATYRSLQVAGTAVGGFFAWLVESEFGTRNVDLGVWDDLREQVGGFFQDMSDVWAPDFERASTQIEQAAERTRRAITFGGDGEAEAAVEAVSEASRRAAEIFRQTRTEVEIYAERLNEAYQLMQAGEIDAETYWRYVEQIEAGLIHIEEVAEEVMAERIPYFADQAARNIQTSLAEFLFDPFDDGLKGMLRGFIDTLRRMAAEAAASQILGALFGGEGGLGAALGGMFGGARASGGPVSAGKAYLVGERGPELVVPRSAGTVVPNGGMGGVTVNIDARGADAQLLTALPPMLNQWAQAIKSDIAMAQQRQRAIA
jgi:hypothetical protein